jgi:hypothetical protein
MKIHKMEIYIVDQDNLGADCYKTELEQLDPYSIVHVREMKSINFDKNQFEQSVFNKDNAPIMELREYFKN